MSVLAGISEQGARVVSFLREAARMDVSANRVLDVLREFKLGYRRSVFLRDYRIIRGAREVWQGLKYVRREAVPGVRHYMTTKSPLKTNYQTVIEMGVTHMETGESATRYVTVGHDVLKKRGELEDIAATTVESESPQWFIEAIMPIEGRACPFKW